MSSMSDGRLTGRRRWSKSDLRQGKLNPKELQIERSPEKGEILPLPDEMEAILLAPPEE